MAGEATPLHRAAAWCAAVVFFALVAVGTRAVVRGLDPEPAVELADAPSSEVELRDVEGRRVARELGFEGEQVPDTSTRDSSPTGVGSSRRSPVWAPGDGPMEKHPYFVFEGTIVSGTGDYRRRVLMEVQHPEGGSAVTELHFDRRVQDGRGWIAPFKLIKPATGAYRLRVRIAHGWQYEIAPREWSVAESTSGLVFHLSDDVEHVDLDVVVVGEDGRDLVEALVDLHEVGTDDGRARRPPFLGGGLSPALGPELEQVPSGTSLDWLAVASGHRPAHGAFVVRPDTRTLTVRLEPGWGVLLWDMNAQDAGPQGEVWLDGRYLKPTDPSGRTYVEADTIPDELGVRFGEHWVIRRKARHLEDPIQIYFGRSSR